MSDLSDFKRIVYEPEIRAFRNRAAELRTRAESAEAEATRLREALGTIKVLADSAIADKPGTFGRVIEIANVARSALAAGRAGRG